MTSMLICDYLGVFVVAMRTASYFYRPYAFRILVGEYHENLFINDFKNGNILIWTRGNLMFL